MKVKQHLEQSMQEEQMREALNTHWHAYTVSIMEFRNGKVVHETQYFADHFEAPAWRSQWVQQTA
jgi:hypothetical protein